MPYVIVSTVALLSNLYKNAPLIVGDKDSDPDLMRYLGARLTTNYPTCGSPAMYVLHAPPRTVFDNLEKRGYCLMAAQTIQEHAVWVLARPRVPDDDKTEIQRGGPNDKAVQANTDGVDSTSGKSSKPVENSVSEATKKKSNTEVVQPTDGKSVKTMLADGHSFSNTEINASKGDYIELKPKLQDTYSISDSRTSPEIVNNNPVLLEKIAQKKSLVGIGVGDELLECSLLLDGCTQTIFADPLWSPSITNLPKVIDTDECSSPPPLGKESYISFRSLITKMHEDTKDNITGICDTSLPRFGGNPIFANLADRTHLSCLTQCEGCCCEE